MFLSVGFGPGSTGLPDVGYQLFHADGTNAGARTSAGVFELVDGSGEYGADPEVAATFLGYVVWDTGEDPPRVASEPVDGRVQRLDAAVSSRSTFAGGAVASVVAAVDTNPNAVELSIQAKTDALPSDPVDQSLVTAATDAIMARLGVPAGDSAAADVAAVLAQVLAVKAKTDGLPASPAAVGDVPTPEQNAAAWGARVIGHGRTADYFLQGGFNRTVRTATAFTVYATDDITVLATALLAQDGNLSPIASVDPS